MMQNVKTQLRSGFVDAREAVGVLHGSAKNRETVTSSAFSSSVH